MPDRKDREQYRGDKSYDRVEHTDYPRRLENLERLDFMHREYSFDRVASRNDYTQLA
jgi:hypothetical protein